MNYIHYYSENSTHLYCFNVLIFIILVSRSDRNSLIYHIVMSYLYFRRSYIIFFVHTTIAYIVIHDSFFDTTYFYCFDIKLPSRSVRNSPIPRYNFIFVFWSQLYNYFFVHARTTKLACGHFREFFDEHTRHIITFMYEVRCSKHDTVLFANSAVVVVVCPCV